MIEFKADCGHTVRARDEDAGGVVECSYCGRNVAIPESGSADVDFLFNEVQQPAEPEEGGRQRRRRKKKPLFAEKKKKPGEFNPFAVALRLCYAAALIIIVVLIGKKFVVPMFDPQKRAQMLSGASPSAAPSEREEASAKAAPRQHELGLIRDSKVTGLWVASTPPGAIAWCIPQSKAPTSGRIHQIAGVIQTRTNDELKQLADGQYLVEMALAWNDPSLKSYPGYTEFRHKLSSGSNEQRRRLVYDYFLPDEATNVLVDQTEEQMLYIVRQYRNVGIAQHQSKGVRALFLPRIAGKSAGTYGIEELVSGYLPAVKTYEFDETNVRDELNFYHVAEADQPWVLQALSRIGLVPYSTPDRQVRMFKIAIQGGAFAAPSIREAAE